MRFTDIRGHERQCDFLKAAVTHERLPHALLFFGPDGIGKRAVALALATWLQCEARAADACGDCAACRQVAAASHPDVQVVMVPQGKKDIGIDRIRELKKFMQLQPLRGTAKVAVIDDAEALTVAAQNALLKTLEEPPDRSFLILIAHNADGLLATVRSRCQRVRFVPLAADAVAAILVADHGIDMDSAQALAALAEGSPGRALALRRGLSGAHATQLLDALAALPSARYVRLMEFASALAQPEADMDAKLEILLAHCGADAVRAVESLPANPAGPHSAVRAALRRVQAIHTAHTVLRRSNPNRQLLLDALLLELARAS